MSKQHTSSYTVQEEAQLTKHQDILLLSRLGQYIKPHSFLLLWAALFLLIAMGLDLLRPLLMKTVSIRLFRNETSALLQSMPVSTL